jgi:CheY-like chemotaxis protein
MGFFSIDRMGGILPNDNPPGQGKRSRVVRSNYRATRVREDFMRHVHILAVGQDPMILSTRSAILRSAGHIVVPASSIGESIELFLDEDFDLVLLCHTVSVEDRDRLTRAILAAGSHIPIYTVAPLSRETRLGDADSVIASRPENLVKEVEQAARNAAALVINVRQL